MRTLNVEQEDFRKELMHFLMEEDIISEPDRAEIRKWASIKKNPKAPVTVSNLLLTTKLYSSV